MNKYTAISLFSGAVDGLAIAAQAAGINVTHHVEWDAWCCRVLRMNHPRSTVINADIKTVKGLPYADVIMGGPPCQGFSTSGNRGGFEDERYLWPEMRRIARECRPRCIIFENVRGGVSLGLLDRVCSEMEADGYTAWPLVYPAAIFGAPHERYRQFIVGLLADTSAQRRPQPRTIAHTSADEQQHAEAFKRSGRTISNAIESGRENMGNASIKYHANIGESAASAQFEPQLIGSNRSIRKSVIDGQSELRELPNGEWDISQSRMDRAAHGSTARLPRLDPLTDFHGFPAGQGSYQHPHEPPRTTAQKGAYAKERIQALGNAIVWQQAAPIMRTVVRWLEGQDTL